MESILVLGSSGMLGHVVMLRMLELGYDVYGISNIRRFGVNSALLDVTKTEELSRFLDSNSFDVIVNCIALLNTRSEQQKDLAVYLNSYLPHLIEKKYADTNTRVVQVSTDGIFSGNNPPYAEHTLHDTEHFYGKSKSLGELHNDKDLTVRSAFWGPAINREDLSLLNWILTQKGTMKGYTNHVFNGVSSIEFACFLDIAIRSDITGVFHLVAKQSISKHDFLLLAKDVFLLPNDVESVENKEIDRTLANSKENIGYIDKDYGRMMTECKAWIMDHPELYEHYNSK